MMDGHVTPRPHQAPEPSLVGILSPPATRWQPQIQGERGRYEHLAGRKRLSWGPHWRWGGPFTSQGQHIHSWIHPRARPFPSRPPPHPHPTAPGMYTQPPRKLQKMS